MPRYRLTPQKYFLHLLITISSFFIAATVLLSGTLYSNFRSFGENMMNRSSQDLLSGIANNVSFIDKYAYNFSASLLSNTAVSQLMYGSNISIYDTLANFQQLQNILQSTPFVYSIYIYNAAEDRYYIIGPHSDILTSADMYDGEMAALLRSSATERTASPVARQVPISGLNRQSTENLYTYWISQSDINHQLTGSLVINVKMNWIFETLVSSAQDESRSGSDMMIVDPSGRVMGHSDSQLFLADLSGESYVQEVVSRPQDSGYFVDKVNGHKSIIVYSSLDQPFWKIINVFPYQTLSQSLHRIGSITLTISLLVFCAGLLISYVLSRRLYSPIRALRQQVRTMLGSDPAAADLSNEFQEMERHVSHTVEHLVALKQFKTNSIGRLKSNFLSSLLIGKASVEQRLDELNLRIADRGYYLIVLIKFDRYAASVGSRSAMEQASLRFALTNIAGELLSARFRCESIDSGEDFCVLIVNSEDDLNAPGNASGRELDERLRELQDVYESYYRITLSCFRTETCDHLSRLHELYHKARQYGMERLRFGHRCLLACEDLQESDAEPFDVSDPLIEAFNESLKRLKREDVSESLRSIMNKLYRCDYNTSMCILSHLLSSSFNYVHHLEKNRTTKFNLSFLAYHHAITGMETLEEIGKLLEELFETIFRQLEQTKDNKIGLIADHVVAYLRQNFRDKNLNQQLVADALKMSPVTLGRIFRDATGSSIADYLKDLRLSKAQEYLRDTNFTIDEIIEEIGWGNKKYFSTVFKTTFAVTPTEYRLNSSLHANQPKPD
ncbi:helix-turn-helix domain-containing protein [Cohnella fermenti]|uniref:Helix-turn-helix domain-containing protein n=1 Tax=Cohnella fermenti TaxID=2565925 RepID=A0A4S4BNW2_9BACL|nr:helix-turn-helix domain-containing protein [Cohnella fermenti]THF76573.1 helix-turn-helix domain-containing protein [Cohnella fermenti]